jgi:hypothetical protein
MLLVVVACLAPALAMGVAQAIASFNGCELDLASAKPCIVGGTDIGETLLTLGMLGYFLFATMPVLVGAVGLWVVVEIVRWIASRRAA